MPTHADARNRFRKTFVLLMVLSISLVFVVTIKGFLTALFLAAVFTGMVYPVYRWLLQRYRGREVMASVTTLLLVVGAIVMPLIVFFGIVVSQAVEVSDIVAPWVERQIQHNVGGQKALPEWVPFAEQIEAHRPQITARFASLVDKAGGFVFNSLSKATQVTAVFLLNLFVMLYAMFFFLISGPATVRTAMGYLPLSDADKQRILDVGLSVSKATLKGTLVIGIVQGALGGLGLAVAGIPGYAFWGVIMMVLSIIPGIGTALVWVPAVVYLAISGAQTAALGLTIWSAAIVGSVDNVLRPRLVGKSTSMPDLLILVSTLGGLGMFGALGLVIGPVIAAMFLTAWTIYGQAFGNLLSEPTEADPHDANG